jgi:hypothetical protein
MERNRRQIGLLVILGLVLVGLLYRALGSAGSGAVTPLPAAATGQSAPPGKTEAVPEVTLEKLEAKRDEFEEAGRNLFKMQPKPAPPPAPPTPPTSGRPTVGDAPPAPPPAPPVPTGPPPPPPITLKFIGVVTKTQGKLAVLVDGKNVYHGREGDIVAGQFRIVKIGEESIEMEFPDGRGRQTIKLTGGS